ncbi:hypothetical protein EZV62_012010 [Acer yangbiense]|uniref:Flavin-containing monooxygenase n=1 Tax=Acer yangbiense TaxID=1000413 RepID=A0A5C7I9G8_9ROSI|nr:hypothetical protein EZV62_012010 [Acer yangbiense]
MTILVPLILNHRRMVTGQCSKPSILEKIRPTWPKAIKTRRCFGPQEANEPHGNTNRYLIVVDENTEDGEVRSPSNSESGSSHASKTDKHGPNLQPKSHSMKTRRSSTRVNEKEGAGKINRGKQVVVGFHKSALDIAMECSEANGLKNQCTVLYRTEQWNVPANLPWGLPLTCLCLNSVSNGEEEQIGIIGAGISGLLAFTENFPAQHKVFDYIQSYAQHFDLIKHIRFNTKVVGIEYEGLSDKEIQSYSFWNGNGQPFSFNGKWKIVVDNT